MSNISWAQPIFGNSNQTSQAYLQRLQEFLAAQSGQSAATAAATATGGSDSSMVESSSNADANSSMTSNHKRKSPATSSEIDTTSALKDSRRQSSTGSTATSTGEQYQSQSHGQSQQHSHATQERSESPPDLTASGSKKKPSTTDKRKEQNRNAQRAFRERKERVLKDLEDKIDGLNKVNEEQLSENQNLRQLVQRLQDENSRLQQQGTSQGGASSAPQSSFTFSMPANLGSTATTSSSGNNAPASFSSDQDILAYLSTPAPLAPPSQVPSLIPASVGDNGSSQSNDIGSIDDWMWNASAFGTEIPQAIPPSVTNIQEAQKAMESGGANLGGLVFPWDQFTNSNASPSITSPASATAGPVPSNDAAAFASFLSSFSPASSTASPASQQQQQQQPHGTNQGSSYGHGQHRGSSGSNSGKTHTVSGQVQQRASSSTADSPETTCSSSGGSSDPSDAAFPGTPNSAMPFSAIGSNLSFASLAGNAFAGQGDRGNASMQFGAPQNAKSGFSPDAALNGSGTASFFSPANTVTTPSSIFDMMNYRDPILANLDADLSTANIVGAGGASTGLSPGQYSSFFSGSGASPGAIKSELLDFNDFFVASPPAGNGNMTASPAPLTGDGTRSSQQQQPYFRAESSPSSSSSVPPRPSTTASNSGSGSASSANSPNTSFTGPSFTAHRSSSASSASELQQQQTTLRLPPHGSGSIADVFPHAISYNHPLIQHVMDEYHMSQQAQQGKPVSAEEAARHREEMEKLLGVQGETMGGLGHPGVPPAHQASTPSLDQQSKKDDHDIDGLCKDMFMKATCKELARQQIQKSISEDERTLMLYNQYLQENASANSQSQS